MQLSVKGRHIDTGEAFRQHAQDQLSTILDKYFGDAIEANVTLSKESHFFRAQVSVHIGRGMLLQASGEANEVYPAFDSAADRLAKRLRRYKRRLRDHNNGRASAHDVLPAQQYILAPEPEPEEGEASAGEGAIDGEGDQPIVIAEMETEIPSLTVGEAVMRMDLAEVPLLMFRNRAHGGLNVVYRRNDGNVGWVDPRGNRDS
ncbi:ribosome hibernation-promoting factor, HPF/YfiA family [Fodinicurvata halophila]|uniref:Ribosome hibernation promoting factor n=1 Tax=Fodinicurvata halophila TaxID=1419723 RepID=A0ABV8UIM8_9PROT